MIIEKDLPTQTNEWDTAATLQTQRHGETGDTVRQLFYDPIISGLLGDTAGQYVLDAGSGSGYWTRRLAQSSAFVVGVDSSIELLKIAGRENNPLNVSFVKMDLEQKLGFRDISLDTVVSNIVLDSVPTIEAFASESSRIIKPGGQLVIGVMHPQHNQMLIREQNPTRGESFDGKPIKRQIYEGQVDVTIYHRSVEDYVNPFLMRGFKLADLLEPNYPDELVKSNPGYKQKPKVPRFLFFKFKR